MVPQRLHRSIVDEIANNGNAAFSPKNALASPAASDDPGNTRH